MFDWVDAVLQWIYDLLLWLPLKLWELFLDGLAAAIEAIPVPDWMAGATSIWAGVTPEMMWFLEAFEVDYGLSVVVAAAVLKFVIRRIPGIG